jgi:tRNA (cytidine/uridine-2'-O-)-methyltransferase
MLQVVLFEPEIPPNTGNVIRLCANTGCSLHLIEPLGFELEDKKLRRAGLDYHEWAQVIIHPNWQHYLNTLTSAQKIYAFSTKGSRLYSDVHYQAGDVLLFGPESRGLPSELRESLPSEQVVRLPMNENSRSLNLSNTVAVAVYEAWRQLGFK